MDWTEVGGVITIFLCIVTSVIAFFLIMLVNTWKLRKQGHEAMALIQEGKITQPVQRDSIYAYQAASQNPGFGPRQQDGVIKVHSEDDAIITAADHEINNTSKNKKNGKSKENDLIMTL